MECDEECIDVLDECYSNDGDSDYECLLEDLEAYYECAPEEVFEEDYYSELKFMRGRVNWDDERNRVQFFVRLCRLIVHLGLECPLPDLRAILQPAEIEWLLAQNVVRPECLGPNDYRYFVIDFVAKTGYKDIPEAVDDYGRISSNRTTAVHRMAKSGSCRSAKTALSELFEIYDRYDVNYRDEDGYTHFHVACQAGCADVVEKFLELGRVDPNELVPETGDSPLYAALKRGHKDVVELLLRAGADPNIVHNSHGMTPLHKIIALKNPNTSIDLLEMFFAICREKERSVKIDAPNDNGLAPLHLTLKWRRHARASEVLATLVANGADPNLPGPGGSTPLHDVCDFDDEDHLVEALFEACEKKRVKLLVDALDNEGRTPLHLALSSGQKKVANALLKRGADPNLPNDHGDTALHVVCADYLERDTDAALFELVASKVRNVNAVNRLGKTPLHVALAAGHQHIVRALLMHGADPNQADSEGSTPLHLVCQKKFEHELTAMLFEQCERGYLPVQVDARDRHGMTPLHWAVYLGHRNSVDELLGYGADPNLADHQGSTSLHVLCQRPNIDEFAQLFFERCAAPPQVLDVDARDALGNTPLHYAVADTCQMQITRLLLQAGADPNLVNDEGSMPLHNICKRKQYQDEDGLTQLFFDVNLKLKRQLRIDARDNSGRTPLELAVANHLPRVVKVLLSNGADVSSFVFPTEAFVAKYDRTQGLCYDATTIKSLISIGHLWISSHYTLDASDGLRIVGLFAEHGLLDESNVLERCLDEDEDFASKARTIMINSYLSLHDLIRLPRGKAARAFTYEDYCEFVNSIGWGNCPAIYREACDAFLCQSMARRFFQRWASEYLMLLIRFRLPLLCCDLIAEHLDLTDVWSICQAANDMNRS
ncbi:hypothetical protein TKK_0005150 [Trichogramma kaykai]|uniref:Uncharacterized protein n=1 Tax=Trichogramma kaykai TaxID=54128 RepID=A0ABD2XKX2_9HYME